MTSLFDIIEVALSCFGQFRTIENCIAIFVIFGEIIVQFSFSDDGRSEEEERTFTANL